MNSRISRQQEKRFTESTDYVSIGTSKNSLRGPPESNSSLAARTSWMTLSQNTPYSRPITSIKPRMPAQHFFSPSSYQPRDSDSQSHSTANLFKIGLRPSIEPDLNATTFTNVPVVQNNTPIDHSPPITSNKFTKKQKRSIEKPIAPDYKRILIGTVDHVIRWQKTARDANLSYLFEAIGILENWSLKGSAQLIFLRGELGQIIQGLFYSVDHALPPLKIGSVFSMVGKMIGSHKMIVFDAKEIPQEDKAAVQRLAFLCQRILNVAANK